jgi:hypothetical protein
MKIFEVAGSEELQVVKKGQRETVLQDPKTGIKTVVPEDPDKPGMIKPTETGEFELSMKQNGQVDKELKPGDTVKVAL